MFNQTFVDTNGNTHKPATMLASTLLQVAALGLLILLPLIYTQVLPSAQLKSLLVAPPPPTAPVPMVKAQPRPIARVFSARLVAPTVIPQRINPVQDAPAAPSVSIAGGANGTGTGDAITNSILGALPGSAPPPAATAPLPKPKPATAPGPLRVGGGVAEANLIHKVMPAYPPLAKSARVQGTVEFTAVINKEGRIEHLQLVRGHPLLVNAAKEAVEQWRYKPTMLNGQPVEVITDIVVNFTLSQ